SCATVWPRFASAAAWASPPSSNVSEFTWRAGCRPPQRGSNDMSDAIGYHKGPDNIVVLTLDAPGQIANTMNAAFRASMAEVVSRLEAEGYALAGVILTSAKKTFFAGGDLNELVKVDKADALDFCLG